MAFVPDAAPQTSNAPARQGFTPDAGYEAQAAIQLKNSAENPELSGILSPEEFAAQYQAARGGNVLQRVYNAASEPTLASPLTVSGVYNDILKPIAGIIPAKIAQLNQQFTNQSIPSATASSLGSDIKSAVEAARQVGTEALSVPSQTQQALEIAAERQKANPIRNTLRLSNPLLGNVLNALLPAEQASTGEINKAYEAYIQQEGFKRAQARPEQQIIGKDSIIPGEVDPEVARGIAELGKILVIPAVGAEERAATLSLGRKVAESLANPKTAFEKLAPNLSARIAKATPAQQATSAFGLDEASAAEHLPVVIKQLKEVGGTLPKGVGAAEKTVKLLDQAEKKLYAERVAVNEEAAKRGLSVNLDEALSDAKASLDANQIIPQAEKDAIFNDLQEVYSGRTSPQKGQTIQEQLNGKFKAGFKNNTLNRADPRYQAELKIRNNIASQMDDMQSLVSGKAGRPYSEIGSIIETSGGLEGKIESLKAIEADIKTGLKSTGTSINPVHPKYGIGKGLIKGSRSPLRKTGMELLDKATEGSLTRYKALPESGNISSDQALLAQQRLTGAAAPSAADALEASIQEALLKLPPEVRGSRLARMAAEQIVRGETSTASPTLKKAYGVR